MVVKTCFIYLLKGLFQTSHFLGFPVNPLPQAPEKAAWFWHWVGWVCSLPWTSGAVAGKSRGRGLSLMSPGSAAEIGHRAGLVGSLLRVCVGGRGVICFDFAVSYITFFIGLFWK